MAEPQAPPAVRLTMISPQFVVPDVVASAEYYRDILGFEILGYFLDPPVYSIVKRDSVEIHFGKTETGTSHSGNSGYRPEGLDAYIWVTNLDPLYKELKGRGAKIVQGPVHRVYKCYEIVVEDNLGFRLAFAMDTRGAKT